MNTLQAYAHNFFFNVYPYLCLAVFLMGSLARFDRDQYTWKSDSSQMLRAGTLRWGSNLFHIGILFLLMGHTVGLLTPHWLYEPFISPERKQVVAVVAGGIAGVVCFIGLTLLLHRRLSDPRIRLTSHRTDLAILIILWVQLTIGLITLPYSFGHEDASVMLALSDWAQRIVTFQPDAAGLVPLAWPYKSHLVLGMTIFLLLPFSRLVHVWSGFASLAYVFRPYQLVRSRRLNLPGGHNTPPARH
ncbi:respiratory nitrate reductase subunit gamma [Candidatus Accumulibacter cognatus]|uniref:nitrate reductase (quinone) n=1 Tax=Candidatus Accumulibacter cognatus TaxID=2954383 RepID=A0A080M2E6_9PROT|nr:respiratory nitrate reductase subunit gamma [Candidatus Accumulibacter cognatus]KFB75447.1 MAG: Respiratory nitrate reductase 1 gamma chain [Candidatus Accumulibacter cognatus]